MSVLYQVARVMLVLGLAGMVVSFVMMLGAFLCQSPWWLVIGVSITTIVIGVIIGKRVSWM